MPQIGQLPGSLRTISGCIGQVHRVPAGAAGADGAGGVAGGGDDGDGRYAAGFARKCSRQPGLQKK
jgi:hypothetical protein